MSTTIPFTASSLLTFPPDLGQPAVDRPSSASGTFVSKSELDYDLTGSGTQAVTLSVGSLGAKALQIEVDSSSANPTVPVYIKMNGGTEQLQITPGGFVVISNPVPSAGGILTLSIVYTVACTVRIRALG